MIDTKLLRKETKLIAENLNKRGFVFEIKKWTPLIQAQLFKDILNKKNLIDIISNSLNVLIVSWKVKVISKHTKGQWGLSFVQKMDHLHYKKVP